VVYSGGRNEVEPEGCFSLKGQALVRRANYIEVRYLLPDNTLIEENLEGFTARVFLHEMQHLDGHNMSFTDRYGEFIKWV
jgi:peptide deformylase